MKYGARNHLSGEVVEIKKGGVMCQVKVDVAPNVRVCSVMTIESAEALGLQVGSRVNVVVKAVNVLLTTE
jgi:molybdate transport system regulatory protein